jgi:8-oxo-dGTP diphosphatase
MKNKIPRVGIGVFIFKNGKFIMGCRKGSHGDGSWSVPGGHLEFGETIEQGAIREAIEETGLQIQNIKVVGITNDIFKAENKHYITIWVASEWKKGKEVVNEPDKFLKLKWCTFETLPENLFLPWVELQKSKFYKNLKRMLKSTL